MSGRVAVAREIKDAARRQARREQVGKLGRVTALSPLTVEVYGYSVPLTEDDDFDLSQWAKLYHSLVGIDVGDVVVMIQHDEWVLQDIRSGKDVAAAFADAGEDKTTLDLSRTFLVPGLIVPPVGAMNVIPPTFMAVASHEKLKLSKVRVVLGSGGTADWKVQRNGVDLPGFSGTATTVPKTVEPSAVAIADGDLLGPVIAAVAGAAANMSLALVFR